MSTGTSSVQQFPAVIDGIVAIPGDNAAISRADDKAEWNCQAIETLRSELQANDKIVIMQASAPLNELLRMEHTAWTTLEAPAIASLVVHGSTYRETVVKQDTDGPAVHILGSDLSPLLHHTGSVLVAAWVSVICTITGLEPAYLTTPSKHPYGALMSRITALALHGTEDFTVERTSLDKLLARK